MRNWLTFILNTLALSLFFTVLTFVSVFIFYNFLSLLRPVNDFGFEVVFLFFMGSWSLFFILFISLHLFETKHWRGHPFRFARFYRGNGIVNRNFNKNDLIQKIESFYFSDVTIQELEGVTKIYASLKSGLYDFPPQAGGHKKYDSKQLDIELDFLNNSYNIQVLTLSRWLPTVFAFSNIFIGESIEEVIKG